MNLSHRPGVPLWLLGLFTFSGPVGMHIFVPALPAAAKDLHARPAALELTISLYILGLAVGNWSMGPLRIALAAGRRCWLASPSLRLRASPGSSLRMSTRSSSRVFSRL
jgi:MFS family permease